MMRNFFLVLIVVVFSKQSHGQVYNTGALADTIIAAFKSKDFQRFHPILTNAADYKELLDDFAKHRPNDDTLKRELASQEKAFADSADIFFQTAFKRLLSKGEKLGIDWTQVKKDSFILQEERPDNFGKKILSGHLNFKYKEKLYVLFGIEAIQFSSGYKISNIRTVLPGGISKYVDPDLLDDDDL